MTKLRQTLALGVGLIMVVAGVAGSGVAMAAHESTNLFDLAVVTAPAGADGSGFSNYISGRSSENEVWNSRVRVTGLLPNTLYTFYAEGGGTQTAICSFTTDADGDGSCRRNFHPEPGLAFARIRLGENNPTGAIALQASRNPADADHQVEDGEIESFGGNRD